MTFLFVKEGKVVDKLIEAHKGKLEEMTVKHMATLASA